MSTLSCKACRIKQSGCALFLSYIFFHRPIILIATAKTTADVWMQGTLKGMGEEKCYVAAKSNKTKAFALLKGDPSNNRFGIKLKDAAITHANTYLRTNNLFPDVESDDEEMVFGDDDFPS